MNPTDLLREAIISQNPTDQQREAIFADELEFLLRASPGSGKTWTSSRRFIWRAINWPYSVGGLSLLSFTNAAISEFKEATSKIGRRDILSDPNYVGTFDSFVERYIMVPFGHLLTGADKRPKLFPGPRPGDRNNTKLKVWRDNKGGRKPPVWAWEVIPYPDGNKSGFKSLHMPENLPGTSANNAVYNLLSLGFYTHSQRIYWACCLLSKKPHIAKLLAKRFPEIIVDEAQDINAWLLILMSLLRREGAKITLVGDPDQCIFEFSMADVTSLSNLKKQWSIPEKPLNQSFRCNNQIADAVRNVGGNPSFTGNGDGMNDWHRAFVVKETSETFSDSVAALQCLSDRSGVSINSSAVICRGHKQLESLRGKVNYNNLEGKAKRLAKAAFLRDSLHDYRGASQSVECVVRELTGDDPLWERIDTDTSSYESMAVALEIRKFVKSSNRLIPVTHLGNEWIDSMRMQLKRLIEDIGLQCNVKLGHHIKAKGLSAAQKSLPLFESAHKFPKVRFNTIHQVKGESIDAVLVIGSTKFWNSVMKAVQSGENTEDRRLAYVAMTRARHLLVIGLPKGHYDKYSKIWVGKGFRVAT